MKAWLSINSACEYLDCSRAHLYAEIKAGRIPTGKLGARIRIHTDDLDAYARGYVSSAAPATTHTTTDEEPTRTVA